MSDVRGASLTSPKEKSIFNEGDEEPSLTDNASFDRTREYTRTIDLLRLLHNALARFIESWQNFEGGELEYFEGAEHEALRRIWDAYLAQIKKNMAELRFMRTTLRQRTELFDNKRSGVGFLPWYWSFYVLADWYSLSMLHNWSKVERLPFKGRTLGGLRE